MQASKVVIESFNSIALEGNPLGDPATRRVPVYLPPGYEEGEMRYPVVYLLTAFAARGLKLLNDNLWEENIQERMDRLIEEEKVSPMIIVMPDASTRLGGSQYINSPATGNYADHILELVGYIDSKYRTLADRDQRSVMGHSSGGYGALRFGMEHADVFGLVAAHAPDLYFEMVYRPDFPNFLRFFEKAGEEGLMDLLDDPGGMLAKGTSFQALAVAAMASCYSPNPESPFGFDLPFHPYTGELHPDVWDRWLANDPLNMVIDHIEALKSLKLLYLDCGIYDEENLLYGARILANRLEAYEVPFWYEEFEGGHRNTKYRYDVSLEVISDEFQRE